MNPAMLALLSVLYANESPARSNLVGIVSSIGGAPIEGAAVFIYQARVRPGSFSCFPSCWPDCQKHVLTNADGKFLVPSLNPALILRILVVANGYAPAIVSEVDPKASPLSVSLTEIGDWGLPPLFAVRGRVLDSQGNPVVAAEVAPFGVSAEHGLRYGWLFGFDSPAITNARGEFALRCDAPWCRVSVVVAARELGRRIFETLEASPSSDDLVLPTRATITGRVVCDGKPVAGVRVGFVQVEVDASFADGGFAFMNVASDPNSIYGIVDGLRKTGSIGITTIDVEADREQFFLGDLEVALAHRLSGHLVLADGKAVPAHARVAITRDAASESQEVEVDRDGAFAFDGLPSGVFTLCASVPGHRVSPDNGSFDGANPLGLIGRIDDDVADLRFLFEPGEALASDRGGGIDASPRERPLCGAPTKAKK